MDVYERAVLMYGLLLIITSRPRLIYGQQYPCPFFFPQYFQIVSRAAVPEGQCFVECKGYFVRGSGLGALAWKTWPGGLGPGPRGPWA